MTRTSIQRSQGSLRGFALLLIFPLLLSCMDSLPPFRGPYLSWKRNPKTTMTITWESLEKTPRIVAWGEKQSALINSTRVVPDRRRDDMYFHFTTTIEDLEPGTEYFYSVSDLMDAPARFRTAPKNADASFSFLVYGDSCESDREKDNQHYDIVAEMNRVEAPYPKGFVISSGDLSPMYADVYGWDLHFDAIRDLADHLPYLTPFGNHDWNRRDPHSANLEAVWIHEFPERADRDNTVSGFDHTSFAFGYGAAYFIFIGYDKIGSKKGSAFNKWLRSQLALALDGYAFTFVDLHVPPFDRRDNGYMDDMSTLRHQAKLFHEYHVTAVFSGHNHLFAHHEIERVTEADGHPVSVTYLISGGGGQVLRSAHEGSWHNRYGLGYSGETRFVKSTYHFLRVDIDGAKRVLAVTAFDRNGEKIYGPFEKRSDR
jgi:hypothetical protein